MHIEIKINTLGKYNTANDKFRELLTDVELWRRKNQSATITDVSKSEILMKLNKCLYYKEISEMNYNTLLYYLYHGHMQYKITSKRRSGVAELDPKKRAYCYGFVESIYENMALIKNVHVEGITPNGEPISFHISHVWIRTNGIKKALATNKIHEGDYIKFRGEPYMYERANTTKDYAFRKTNNKTMRVISKDEYEKYAKIGM